MKHISKIGINLFRYFIVKIFFNRWNALLFSIAFSIASYFIGVYFNKPNALPSSGAIYTIAGFFLNIKLTAHFHLQLPSGEPLGLDSKYAMITGRSTFGGNESKEEKERVVNEVQYDELMGMFLIVIGTLIWAYC